MSSRVLKKLQGENELELKEQDEQTSDMEIDLAAGNRKKQLNINRYDLLNQHSPSESEVKEDDNETEHASAANNATICNLSKKKRKKRKKKSSKHSGQQISSEDNEISDKFLNDIDPFLQKANKSPRVTVPESTNDTGKSLLSVEYKNLNPHYEMRRTFGKRVVKIENKRGRPKPMLKSTYLVSVKDSWPPVSKDIIHMVPCSPPEGVIETKNVSWFQFEHSKMYQSVQNMFLSAVEGMDSEFLVHVIKRCPYHVDALIQLSEICKMSESYAVASELIERAVLVLESSLHPTFSLISGNCRLDYRKQENRSFFIALFKHAQYLEDRACCRTAFEISKLILNLDPETDPLAIVLIIDYYALRSKQYTWLIKFYDEFNSVKNLSQLPNMAYSYALALFYSCGDSEEADEALQYALLMFPGVLRPLLDVLSVQTDKRVLAHSYFTPETSNNQSPSLHQLCCLHICRAKNVWRDQSVLPWLERNVNVVLDRVDNKDEIVNEYSQKRAQRYINPPRAILRHVVLSDFKEKVPLAPFVFMEKEPIMMYDPLPPLDSINFYERKAATSTPAIPNSSSLSMFFQSMLPTFNIRADQNNAAAPAGAAPAAAPADNNVQEIELNFDLDDGAGAYEGAGMQSYRELRSSLNSVVDAMRDFLSSIHITEGTPNHDGDDNESSEEDSSDYSD